MILLKFQGAMVWSMVASLTAPMASSLIQKILVWLLPLSNIKITKYLNYEPRFIGVFSIDNLHRIKDDDKK